MRRFGGVETEAAFLVALSCEMVVDRDGDRALGGTSVHDVSQYCEAQNGG